MTSGQKDWQCITHIFVEQALYNKRAGNTPGFDNQGRCSGIIDIALHQQRQAPWLQPFI
jgi:hypothetical protein